MPITRRQTIIEGLDGDKLRVQRTFHGPRGNGVCVTDEETGAKVQLSKDMARRLAYVLLADVESEPGNG